MELIHKTVEVAESHRVEEYCVDVEMVRINHNRQHAAEDDRKHPPNRQWLVGVAVVPAVSYQAYDRLFYRSSPKDTESVQKLNMHIGPQRKKRKQQQQVLELT